MTRYNNVESAVHTAIIELYSRRVTKYDFDHLLQSGELRSSLLAQTLTQVLQPYGTSWMPFREAVKHELTSLPLGTEIQKGLQELRERSQFLSFHLFDPLDNKRRAIYSVMSDDFIATNKKDPSTIQARYEAIERFYLGLTQGHRRRIPTLVNSLREAVGNGPARQFAFVISQNELQGSWPWIKFPFEYCEEQFSNNEILQKWNRTCDIQSFGSDDLRNALLRPAAGDIPPFFLEGFRKATGFQLTKKIASAIALSFYLWERGGENGKDSFTIMPYYFRGLGLSLPKFKEMPLRHEPEHAFLAVSCSATRSGLDVDDLGFLDSFARGLASALTICGVEMARDTLSIVFLPEMLRHEVGNPLLRLSSKLSELSEGTEGLAPELQRDLRYLAGELAYVRALATEIADFPNPNQPLPLSFVLVRNQVSSFWAKLFRQLIAADPTAMSIVRLVVGREKNMTSISYSAVERTDLENLPWPPAPCVSVQHLRQILQNLVNNSMKRGGAKSIEVEVGVTEAPRGYVKLTLRDDGRPYLRSEGDVRFRFGELIISRIFESIRQEFPKAGFHTPDEGAKGRKKTFSMILPLA